LANESKSAGPGRDGSDFDRLKQRVELMDERLDNIDSVLTAVAERIMKQPLRQPELSTLQQKSPCRSAKPLNAGCLMLISSLRQNHIRHFRFGSLTTNEIVPEQR
jgi:hypothetical protein